VWAKKALVAAAVLLVFFMGFVAGAGSSAFAGHGFFKTIKSFFGSVVNISGITQTGQVFHHRGNSGYQAHRLFFQFQE
jgi:hypothetical protein